MMIEKVTSGVNLIGIAGIAGAGKTSAAKFLCDTYKDVYVKNFADPLKEACSVIFNIPLDNFYEPDLKEVIDEDWCMSPRKILQIVGTDLFRDCTQQVLPFQRNVWIASMCRSLNNLNLSDDCAPFDSGDTVVIGDVRFRDELEFIIRTGGTVIHIIRNSVVDLGALQAHPSEHINSIIEEFKADNPELGGGILTLHNDSDIQNLYEQLAAMFIRIKREQSR